jgi:hypothetical protein
MNKWQDAMPKWSNPPTDKQKQDYFGRELVRLYVEQFGQRVKRHEGFAELTLHCIIGQLPSVKKMRIKVGSNELDLRISGCFFKPSGSGGGRGFNFMSTIARGLKLNYRVVTEITDAALIGTCSEERVYDPQKKGMTIIQKIDRGALDPTDDDKEHPPINIVAMNEADILFSGGASEFKKNAMLYYQIALNTMGTEDNKLTKKLAHGEWIEFNPNCSLMLMSYPPDSFYDTIVKRGFLQRMVILNSDFGTVDRIGVAKELTEMLGADSNDERSVNELIKRLDYVNTYWAGREKEQIIVDAKAIKVLVKLVDEFFIEFEGIADYPKKKLEEFSQRWIEHIWRLAWHHMILRMDNKITLEDVGYAKSYIMPVWKRLVGLLEEGIVAPRDHERRNKMMLTEAIRLYTSHLKKNNLKDGTPVPRSKFCKKLATTDYWGVSYKTASQRIRGFEDEGWFERAYQGTAPMIKLVKLPKWLKSGAEGTDEA